MERLTEKHYLGTDHYMKCSGNCNVDMDCMKKRSCRGDTRNGEVSLHSICGIVLRAMEQQQSPLPFARNVMRSWIDASTSQTTTRISERCWNMLKIIVEVNAPVGQAIGVKEQIAQDL